MSARPWLSVLLPTYNSETYLSSTLDSICIQEDSSIECIVVDDGSTDATRSILDSYRRRLPITVLERDRRGNWAAGTNEALSLASGEYVCFLHHDDLWLKHRLSTIRELIAQFPKVVLVLHPSNFVDRRGRNLGLWSCPLPASPRAIGTDAILERLLVQNFISIVGAVFKREAAERVGGLDDSLWYTADWDFWLKIVTCGDSLYYAKPLSGFRIHPASQTALRSSYVKDFRAQLQLVAGRHLDLWQAPRSLKERVRRAAYFSIDVNSLLASVMHGARPNPTRLLFSLMLLGPDGWHRYFRDSRIWQRVSARLRAGLTAPRKQQSNSPRPSA